ncbi:hypothetical protein [Pseudobacteriovorax antillogorgiicola]|uniref:TIGR02147 family protein n=1 Tax=Pseudobacteriovorax antillogorgiicola TaxID=1513793 RepID=A0A1Y6CLZ7_9BACT|nr:hypothetical protein [Pseudobacteriovorax antillogorgiicola]TCS47365.1 hypothetical protein EDD56_121140 [Pseudobacteriovorax antillogorgiicola]SMF63469.1 hypothetical protein SAMN06296036_121140 [Pseudobacteriovorax antillogorgiicola]
MVIEPIVQRIEQYLGEHKSRNMRTLERRSGVNYSSIRRLLQREVSDPSVEKTLFPLLSVFMDNNEIVNLFRECNIEFANHLESYTSYSQAADYRYKELDQVILALASKPEGAEISAIERHYGTIAKSTIETLISLELLRREGDRVFSGRTLLNKPQEILDCIKAGVDSFDTDHLGKGAYYHHFHGAIPESYCKLLLKKQHEWVELLNEAVEKKGNTNEKCVPVILSAIGDYIEETEK